MQEWRGAFARTSEGAEVARSIHEDAQGRQRVREWRGALARSTEDAGVKSSIQRRQGVGARGTQRWEVGVGRSEGMTCDAGYRDGLETRPTYEKHQ